MKHNKLIILKFIFQTTQMIFLEIGARKIPVGQKWDTKLIKYDELISY